MVIDGAMGTTVQQYKFTEEDFRGASLTLGLGYIRVRVRVRVWARVSYIRVRVRVWARVWARVGVRV